MPSADEILQRMRQLQESREQAIGPLVDVLAKRSALLEQLAALDESYGKAYVDAEAAGWTSEELAQLGAEEPVKRPKGRTRRNRSAAKKPAANTDAPAAAIPSQDGPPTQGPPIPTGTSA